MGLSPGADTTPQMGASRPPSKWCYCWQYSCSSIHSHWLCLHPTPQIRSPERSYLLLSTAFWKAREMKKGSGCCLRWPVPRNTSPSQDASCLQWSYKECCGVFFLSYNASFCYVEHLRNLNPFQDCSSTGEFVSVRSRADSFPQPQA